MQLSLLSGSVIRLGLWLTGALRLVLLPHLNHLPLALFTSFKVVRILGLLQWMPQIKVTIGVDGFTFVHQATRGEHELLRLRVLVQPQLTFALFHQHLGRSEVFDVTVLLEFSSYGSPDELAIASGVRKKR